MLAMIWNPPFRDEAKISEYEKQKKCQVRLIENAASVVALLLGLTSHH
jgi:hypothetical protein